MDYVLLVIVGLLAAFAAGVFVCFIAMHRKG